MRKILVSIGLLSLFFLCGKANAALPQDQLTGGRTVLVPPLSSNQTNTTPPVPQYYYVSSYYNTSLIQSTVAASGAAASIVFPVVQSTWTTNAGVSNSTITARNCITDLFIGLTVGGTFYMLDGGTTDYYIPGATLSSTTTAGTPVSWTKHWDSKAPWCGTAGNTLTLSIPAPTTATVLDTISADGYTIYTGPNSVYNNPQ